MKIKVLGIISQTFSSILNSYKRQLRDIEPLLNTVYRTQKVLRVNPIHILI